jgi:hypothetical protein
MNALAPPPPNNPAIGDFWQNFVWNGMMWVCSPPAAFRVVVQNFNVPGTFTYMPSPGLVNAIVECIGGGGGGGGVTQPSAIAVICGGGGGSGGYSRKYVPVALVSGGVLVTVGAGGVGGADGGAPGTAQNGGATSFGGLCMANGGELGAGNSGGTTSGGAAGQTLPPGIGDVTFAGNGGFQGQTWTGSGLAATIDGGWNLHGPAGGGGGGPWGGVRREHGPAVGNWKAGGQGVDNTLPGVASWPTSGAGGSGAATNRCAAGISAPGGDGASGSCVVTEFCVGNVTGGCPPTPIHPPGCGCGCQGGRARQAFWGEGD